VAPAGYLYAATSALVGSAFDVATFQVYLDRFLKDAGAGTDPVERMLLEQLALSHHVIGCLSARAGSRGEDHERMMLLLAGAARLMAEFRRTALALKDYRQGVDGGAGPRDSNASPQAAEVPAKQAAGLAPDGRYPSDEGSDAKVPSVPRKLPSNKTPGHQHHGREHHPQSETGRRRPAESPKAAGAYARGA
jgi:hypothetical protein